MMPTGRVGAMAILTRYMGIKELWHAVLNR